jgi:hypothetical protein
MRKACLTALLVFGATACGGSSTPPPPPRAAAKPAAAPAVAQAGAATAGEGDDKLLRNSRWETMKDFFFAYADTPLPSVKNVFLSNMDKYMPQLELPKEEAQGPEAAAETEMDPLEKFPPEDYKLIMVISGTPVPKAIVYDPVGHPHVVRKDMRLGNRNGVIDEITEFEVVVKEPFGEKPVVMSIKPKFVDWEQFFQFKQ